MFLELKETLKDTQQEVLIETHDTLEKLNRKYLLRLLRLNDTQQEVLKDVIKC